MYFIEMMSYTQTELNKRNKIIQSQKIFWDFLDTYSINKLTNLFDNNNHSNESITKYIDNERKLKKMDISGVDIVSQVYDDNQRYNFLLEIKKNNKRFVHLSIHLSPETFDPKLNGVIHIFKNFYKRKKSKTMKPKIYALIGVTQHKPKSLKFSIDDGYTTGFVNDPLYDPEIQQEMDVIITVLNRLFDEDNDEFYIGNKDEIIPIHMKINTILENINTRAKQVSRKNKGNFVFPPLNIANSRHTKTDPKRKRGQQITRKKSTKYIKLINIKKRDKRKSKRKRTMNITRKRKIKS